MKVNIHYNGSMDRMEAYDLEPAELRRLAEDFEMHCNVGSPKIGMYKYRYVENDIKRVRYIFLEFWKVKLIE